MLTNKEEHTVYAEARQFVAEAQGTNFCLWMRQGDDLVKFERHNQPCQGGEMRKYKKTHPETCTRPDDPRPGDLRHPFPDGIPEAVAVRFRNPIPYEILDSIFESGPYSKVINRRSWTGISNDYCGKRGLFVRNTDFDPTAFVNLLQFLNSITPFVTDDLLKMGFDYDELPTIMYLTNPGQSIRRGAVQQNSYYFSVNAAIHRVVNGEFTDLSGGSFKDGYDYNRPEIQNLYKAVGDETGTNFMQELNKRFKWRSYGAPDLYDPETGKFDYSYTNELVPICREIIAEAIKKEEERVKA